MRFLLDTNILLRFSQRTHPLHTVTRAALRALLLRGDLLGVTPQNLVEFWGVCTRPATARGGFGLSIAQTDRATRLIERLFHLLPDDPAIYPEWRRLVVTYAVEGVSVHDARLAAAMHIHGLTHILTFDTGDFARYPGITAVHPQDI